MSDRLKKPKLRHRFKSGQVVAIREHGQLYARVNMPDKFYLSYYLALKDHGYHLEKELRPLTKREMGV